MLSEAVEATVAALDPPEQDAALVALARHLAAALDGELRPELLGQTAPQLLKVLQELEARHVRRHGKAPPAKAAASKVSAIRQLHQDGKRKQVS